MTGLPTTPRERYVWWFHRQVLTAQRSAAEAADSARRHYRGITTAGSPELDNGYPRTRTLQKMARMRAEHAREMAEAFRVMLADAALGAAVPVGERGTA